MLPALGQGEQAEESTFLVSVFCVKNLLEMTLTSQEGSGSQQAIKPWLRSSPGLVSCFQAMVPVLDASLAFEERMLIGGDTEED